MPSSSDSTQDIDRCLQTLNKLRTNFQALQNHVLTNPIIQDEHELYVANKSKSNLSFFPSSLYINTVVEKFTAACQQYDEVKKQLSAFISKEELEALESGVIKAAGNQELLDQLMYFPTYQAIHEKNIKQHRKQMNQYEDDSLRAAEEIQANYNARSSQYAQYYFGTGLLSMILVGIPLFVCVLATHTLDKLVTPLRVAYLKASAERFKQNSQKGEYKEKQTLEKNIQSDKSMLALQGFFSLTKLRHAAIFTALENKTEQRSLLQFSNSSST